MAHDGADLPGAAGAEELGDVLLQVAFHARVAEDHPTEPFDIDSVAGLLVDKLVRRHPHVFADGDASTPEEVEAAARQFVRKLSGIRHPSAATAEPFDRAVADIAAIAARMLEELPPRKQPPTTVPPNRRRDLAAAAERD